MKLFFVGNVPETHAIPEAMIVVDFTGKRFVLKTPFTIKRKYCDPLSFETVVGPCRYAVAFKKLNSGKIIHVRTWAPKQ